MYYVYFMLSMPHVLCANSNFGSQVQNDSMHFLPYFDLIKPLVLVEYKLSRIS
jgi:hypothetical protein